MPLRTFNPQVRVTAAGALHDGIEFTLPLGLFRDLSPNQQEGRSGIDVNEVAECLGAPPLSTRSSENSDIQSFYSCFFNRAVGYDGGPERQLYVRREPIEDIEDNPLFQTAPLCAGMLNLRRTWAGGEGFVRTEYWANVNPTRFLRYQRRQRSNSPFVVPPLFMEFYGAPDEDEFAADGNDNWLPEIRTAGWRNHQEAWVNCLRLYFTEIEQSMRQEMQRRAEISSLDGTGTLSFTASSESWLLRRVETYWEFDEAASPEVLTLFDDAMRSYSALPHVRSEFDQPHWFDGTPPRTPRRVRERTGRNGVSYAVTARPGIRIVAYAKTNRRIRFEVRHSLSDLRPGYNLRRRIRGVEGMVEALQAVSEDAAEILNGFLTHLERVAENRHVPVSPSPTEFLFQVASLCESKNAAEVIVNLLLTERAVTRVEWLNNSIDALKRAGIIERTANAQRQQSVTFVVTPEYARAQEYLISVARPNDLTVRRRRRTP